MMTSQTDTTMGMATPPADAAPTDLVPMLRGAFRAPAMKLILLLVLMLLMQVPLSMVDGVVTERQERQESVLAQFRGGWGAAQTLLGPILVVPYDVPADPDRRQAAHRGSVEIVASRLSASATLLPQQRRKGFFTAIVYTADIALDGTIAVPAVSPPEAGGQLDWRDAFVMLSATDFRGLPADAAMTLDGHAVTLEAAPASVSCDGMQTVIARLSLTGPLAADSTLRFSQHLTLRGTEALRVAPLARETQVTLAAPWATPSFPGDIPPLSYNVTDHDFTANWQVTTPQAASRPMWSSAAGTSCVNGAAAGFSADAQPGVELLEAVPTYRMVARAAKYANLFLALAFLTYFLFETIAGTRIHFVQYGMLGLSISLFALLLVSFGEPLGFAAAYAISTALVLGQASLFTLSVTRRAGPSMAFAALLATLFAFLYVVLSLETYSLLMGSVAVFAALSVVMATTRRIRWGGA